MKHHPSPTSAISTPPIDGPSIRLRFTIMELSAIALGRSAGSSSISTTNAWRAGVSNALMTPWNSCSRMIWVMVMMPGIASNASASDWSIESTWVQTRILCLSQRSTSTPATGASSSAGICPANPTMPSSSAEPVSR